MEYKVKYVNLVKFSYLNNQDVNGSTLIIGTRNFHFNRFFLFAWYKNTETFELVKESIINIINMVILFGQLSANVAETEAWP